MSYSSTDWDAVAEKLHTRVSQYKSAAQPLAALGQRSRDQQSEFIVLAVCGNLLDDLAVAIKTSTTLSAIVLPGRH